jgi:hypothetical protein
MAKHIGPPESGADSSADSSADHPHSDLDQDRSQGLDDEAEPGFAPPPARFGRLALWIASTSALTVGVLATVAYGVWFDQDQRAYAKAMAAAQQTLSSGVGVVSTQQTLSAGTASVPAQQALSVGAAVVPEQQTLSTGAAVVPVQQALSTGEAIVPVQQALSTSAAAVPEQLTLSASEAAVPRQQTAWSGHVAPAPPPSAPPTATADAAAAADLSTPTPPAQSDSTDPAQSESFAPHSSIGQPVMASHGVKQDRHRPGPRPKPNNGLFTRMHSLFHRVSYRQHGNGSQRDLYAHS